MIITTLKAQYGRTLKPIAEDPRYLTAYSSELQEGLSLQPIKTIQLESAGTLILASALPLGTGFRKQKGTEARDFDTVKILAQELILPMIAKVAPVAKPYVTGVQALWLTADLFKEISEEEFDGTKATIKAVRLANKAVDALLTFQGAPDSATMINSIAGLCVATADKLYVARLDEAGTPGIQTGAKAVSNPVGRADV
jgi:hypothetical protein